MTTPRVILRLFDWKVRGVRWVEIIGVVCVAVMVFSVYIAKTAAARESAQINELERDISQTRQRVRLLRAEISHLEQPGRLEDLSHRAGLAPVDVRRQTTEAALPSLKPVAAPPAPVVPAAPAAPASDVPAEAAAPAEALR